MKERPILFSGAMVRAILEDRKTQTRRVVKPPRGWAEYSHCDPFAMPRLRGGGTECTAESVYDKSAPYGQPGDRLWVRETWQCGDYFIRHPQIDQVRYRATDAELLHWRPSIHMPRWASRIQLEITGVRVERLQDISEADAISEGVYSDPAAPARDGFMGLWDSINVSRGFGWAANPWVWVVSFRRID